MLRDFHALWPEKFSNKTNGVTPRRWLVLAIRGWRSLITRGIGDGWTRDLDAAARPRAAWPTMRISARAWRDVKRANKVAFARYVQQERA